MNDIPEFSITTEVIGKVTVLRAEGKLVITNTETFRTHCDNELRAGSKRFILDFTQCLYMDSAGLGELVAFNKQVHNAGGKMKLLANGQVCDLLTLTIICSFPIRIYDTEANALNNFDDVVG